MSSSRHSDGSVFAMAHAICGEDDARDYRIIFELIDGRLTLKWGEAIENTSLRRCGDK